MPFTYPQKIKFKHCDPAGIVFYPRYFEMINDVVEAFFEDVVGYSFGDMQKGNGIPTAQISAEFTAVSRLEDRLEIEMRCERLGRSSLNAHYVARCGDEIRFTARSTLVFIDKTTGRSTRWPDPVRAILTDHVAQDT